AYHCAAFGDPVLVAQRAFVDEGDDGDPAGRTLGGGTSWLGRRAEGQLDRGAAGAREQRVGAGDRVDGAAVDIGEDGAVADAGAGQRGAGPGVGGLAGQDPLDRPAALAAHEVGAEQALRAAVVRWALVAAGGGDIGVGGAEFAEHLAQQVGELVGGGDAFDQGPVLVEHAVPVDAAHAGVPEVGADQPARLLVGAAPLGGRV